MRTRQEIEQDAKKSWPLVKQGLILEILLDIRDLLTANLEEEMALADDVLALKNAVADEAGAIQNNANATAAATKTINDFVAFVSGGGVPTPQQLADIQAATASIESAAQGLNASASTLNNLAAASDPTPGP